MPLKISVCCRLALAGDTSVERRGPADLPLVGTALCFMVNYKLSVTREGLECHLTASVQCVHSWKWRGTRREYSSAYC